MAGGDSHGEEAELLGLTALRAAIDALDAVALETLSDDELHSAVVAAEQLRGRLGVVCGRFQQRWEARRVWAADGSRSASTRLARDTKCSPSSAAVALRRARQQVQLPATVAAIARGDLSLDHLDLLGRANQPQRAELFARDESMLVAPTVLGVSRRRSFIGALRRAIEVRDRHCRHPAGCDIPASDCDVDHIVPHGRGGPTSQFNGRLECTSHNRLHDLHDHHATPYPERPINRLDVLRARLRWRLQHQHGADSTDDIAHDRMQC